MSSFERLRDLRGGFLRIRSVGNRTFPWRAPRHELLLLALVAVAALSPLYEVSAQDESRVCVAEALIHGRLSNDECLSSSIDHSRYGGHYYTDKAPGLSLLEVPSVALLKKPGPARNWPKFDIRLWGVRVLTVGIAFLVCAFLVGRIGEGLAPGFGGAALVTLSLGTLLAPLAATGFDHVLSAALGFGAFVLAWRRRPALAGLVAGGAVLVDYEAGLILAVVGAYVALQGWRPASRYLVSVLPGLALLGAYDWAAFGAPWHLSYRYLDSVYADVQGTRLFGIGVPHPFGIVEVFAGSAGLLVVSPVLVLAAYGLVLLYREHPAETIVCGIVSAAYILVNTGYFLPYGGGSPGPRFLVPSLPFLAVGFGPAFRAYPRLTALISAASIVPITALTLVWSSSVPLRHTVWGELVRVPVELGRSRLVENLVPTVLSEFVPGRVWGGLLVAACAVAAFAVAVGSFDWRALRREQRARLPLRPKRAALVGLACVYLVVVADVLAVFAYPYGDRVSSGSLAALSTSIQGSTIAAFPGSKVDFVVTVSNASKQRKMIYLMATIKVPPGMRLLDPPGAETNRVDASCTGSSTLNCDLRSLKPGASARVRFGVTITGNGTQTLTASASSAGISGRNHPSFTVQVGE